MKYDTFYYLTREFNGYRVGAQIRVHDWNDTSVQISINGSLEWISADVFKSITEHVENDYWTGDGDNRRDNYSEFNFRKGR